jgi:hypothetical protein
MIKNMSIDRGNSKHGPRLDDQMAHEVKGQGRIEQWREAEPAADGQPEPGWIPPGHHGLDTGDDREPERRDERALLGGYIPRDIYPADREKILEAARAQRAPDQVLDLLNRLPEGVTYLDPVELWKELDLHSDR